MKGLFAVLSLLGLFLTIHAENTRNVCQRDPPDTSANRTPGDNGFRIKLAGRPQVKYTPKQVYTVSINGTYPNQKLIGFMLVAVPLNAKDESTAMGVFQHMNDAHTKFAEECEYIVTHTYDHPKAGVEVLWTAPPPGTGCIEFRATVIEHGDIWYKDDGALTKVFCEDSGTTESAKASDMVADCCACGTGKYQMTFQGTWSHRSHPKDFPTHKPLMHWSNIVGASHSKNYKIWEYGGYSTAGIKEVCEFGYPRTLEEEMRDHSRDVRTVIKTPGIWWSDQHGLEQTRWARFSVDRKNHLLTMLSMVGPSPDWCVGVSGLDLCIPENCTWAGDQTIELYPWDAGTDEGITYMSRNMKSDPPQKIQRMTNSVPNNPNSPFYGPEPMKPLAVLKIRRIHPKEGESLVCSPDDIAEEEEDLEESQAGNGGVEGDMDGDGVLSPMEKQKLMMMKQAQMGKCAVTDWADWSSCSVTCGRGQRFRKRMFLNVMVDEDMCGIELMESENCIGVENECESLDEECAMTSWSDWSPCSVTCGKGIRERRRYYMRKQDMMTGLCTRQAEEQEMCIASVMDCDQANNLKNFSAICNMPMEVGPCRASFTRWYYDTDMNKCLRFYYGGCRGNNNRFDSEDECMDNCIHRGYGGGNIEVPFTTTTSSYATTTQRRRKNDRNQNELHDGNEETDEEDSGAVHCMLSHWSDWSECSTSCGKSYRYKSRMIKREAEKGGKKCPKKLEKRKKCDVPKCHGAKVDCQLTPWSKWSSCSASCGQGYRYKRRTISQQPSTHGKECPSKLERKRVCNLPSCTMDCQMSDWGEWTPCAKTCGQDSIQERSRKIISQSRRGGQECGSRIERRYCDLPPCPSGSHQNRQKRGKRHRSHDPS